VRAVLLIVWCLVLEAASLAALVLSDDEAFEELQARAARL